MFVINLLHRALLNLMPLKAMEGYGRRHTCSHRSFSCGLILPHSRPAAFQNLRIIVDLHQASDCVAIGLVVMQSLTEGRTRVWKGP